ncbi:DUF983 domain-containing protein [Pontibacter cellulosilyticus]|uniref:DUF983 domain-containing protein n=1 Tax=Pontibacter cellulosilyticus TaxID=1720253 RepID=A0A923N5J4_9BACT|nr:DUF983 domain-containing protein [Pontibacter cellulosilyticus]MBC5992598.1 DUF983 domain-containing protein [Pontibacter cellulosilyticus]
MSQRKSLLYGIVAAKCPRCREGEMFPKGTLYTAKFADMHPNCPCCGQTYEPEPGFYYGAMYVSFALNVGIFLVSLFILYQFVEEITMAMMIGIVAVVVIGLLPIIFRLSRVLWINIFIRYEGPCSQIPKKM